MNTGEAYIIDFSHATRSRSREAKSRELKELHAILRIEDTKVKEMPAVKTRPGETRPDETSLRRSLRIREAKKKADQVEEVKKRRRRHRN
jgi:hypothetical protein